MSPTPTPSPTPARRRCVADARAARRGRHGARPLHVRGERRAHAVGDVRRARRRGRAVGRSRASTRSTSGSRPTATPTGTSRTCASAAGRAGRESSAMPVNDDDLDAAAAAYAERRCPSASTSCTSASAPTGTPRRSCPGDPVLDVTRPPGRRSPQPYQGHRADDAHLPRARARRPAPLARHRRRQARRARAAARRRPSIPAGRVEAAALARARRRSGAA